MALAILLIILAIWVLVNTMNGTLPGWASGTVKLGPA
jgi:flagellar biogenesis protein FliO